MDSKKKIKSLLGALKPKKLSKKGSRPATRPRSSKTTFSKPSTSFLKPPPPPPINTQSNTVTNSADEFEDGSIFKKKEHFYDPRRDYERDEDDLEAIQKDQELRSEKASAAKVIVSDEMMRDALSEIESKSKRSSRSIFSPRSLSSALPKDPGAGGDGDEEAASVLRARQLAHAAIEETLMEDEVEADGCPLDQILEFLQAVMMKDYKRGLVLGKEVARLEPHNELIKEFVSTLKKLVKKEREEEAAGRLNKLESGSDSSFDSDEEGTEVSDEMTTSSETSSDSDSEDKSWSSTSAEEEAADAKPESEQEQEESKPESVPTTQVVEIEEDETPE